MTSISDQTREDQQTRSVNQSELTTIIYVFIALADIVCFHWFGLGSGKVLFRFGCYGGGYMRRDDLNGLRKISAVTSSGR